jgi:hypothetical protein
VELPDGDARTAPNIDGLGSDDVPQDQLRTGIGEGMFGTENQMAGGGMSAIASGELFFHPPDDYDQASRTGRYEIASLFSPYWEVHLLDTPPERRFMAWALRDETLLTDGASGVVEGVEHFGSNRAEELERLRQLQASLQYQLDNNPDDTRSTELEGQLVTVSSQIDQLESADYPTESITDPMEHRMTEGIEYAENAQMAGFQEMVQTYGEQQGEAHLSGFRDEYIEQATNELHQILRQANPIKGVK